MIETTEYPEDLGLTAEGIDLVYSHIQSWIRDDKTPGAAIALARQGKTLTRGFGYMSSHLSGDRLSPRAIFLTASVSKPVTCAAVVLLIEREEINLQTPVSSIIPDFSGQGKDGITVQHLLTHTSGLPDMIPENIEYRRQHKPLDDFIKRIYELDLLFEPGTGISYQSTGIAILGEIVKRVTGTPLPAFLRQEIFLPLGMNDTSLGSQNIDINRVPLIRIGEEQVGQDWNWNNAYWRTFGAPWGGMFSTVEDISIFCQLFLTDGTFNQARIFAPESVKSMRINQTQQMPNVTEKAKKREAWGLGWRLNQPQPAFGFDHPPSPQTFGHYGATGTMVWADPSTGLSCALFTTQPTLCHSAAFHRCTDLVVGAIG